MEEVDVCLIDDDEAFCRLTRRALEQTGRYKVQVFQDAREGLASVQRHPPHILLLDITLPGLDGLAILEQIKSSDATCQVPVVIVTGHAEPEFLEKAVYNYAEHYLVKPFDPATLVNTLDRVLEARALRNP